MSATAPAPGEITVTVTGLRSAKGKVIACLTANERAFPECEKDPHARSATAPADGPVELTFSAVPPGRYAIALFHDENDNGKLDKQLMLPSEGYGFSRDAPVRFGPPSFARAAFVVESGENRQAIKMRYLF